jgi:hypothetical protein
VRQVRAREKWIADGEFWLKISLAAFIAVFSSIALVTFILPYGAGWILLGLSVSLLVLALFLRYLLA